LGSNFVIFWAAKIIFFGQQDYLFGQQILMGKAAIFVEMGGKYF
jgi:hypothetical protein